MDPEEIIALRQLAGSFLIQIHRESSGELYRRVRMSTIEVACGVGKEVAPRVWRRLREEGDIELADILGREVRLTLQGRGKVEDEIVGPNAGSDLGGIGDTIFKDTTGAWLTAAKIQERYEIPDSSLSRWRNQGCPHLEGQKLVSKFQPSIGIVYHTAQIQTIADRRDSKRTQLAMRKHASVRRLELAEQAKTSLSEAESLDDSDEPEEDGLS